MSAASSADGAMRVAIAAGWGDIREGIRYLTALAIFGLGSGALIAVAGAITGLRAPWWMIVVNPVTNVALGLAAGLLLRYFGGPALRRYPNVPPWVIGAILSALGVTAAFVPMWYLLSPILVGPVLWDWTRQWVPLAALLVTSLVLVLFGIYGLLSARLRVSFAEIARRRELERFLPAEAVERVLSVGATALRSERRTVTVLFADLRDSTARGERLSPGAVVEFLNRYVGAMAESVFANGGMLDKYMGDGVMAIFGLVGDGSSGAELAVHAALQMRREIERLNADEAEPVRYGIGIHTGDVVLGAVGVPRRSDFTAVGDAVNVASRLEGLCKQFRVDCVISDASAKRLDGTLQLRRLGTTEIRGRSTELTVWTPLIGR